MVTSTGNNNEKRIQGRRPTNGHSLQSPIFELLVGNSRNRHRLQLLTRTKSGILEITRENASEENSQDDWYMLSVPINEITFLPSKW